MTYYANPVEHSADFADPFLLRFNGQYYLYVTHPEVLCWMSNDLVSWTLEGPTVPSGTFPDMVPFAPEVTYADGWFYMVTSPHGRGHYTLKSRSPLGPFELITDNYGRTIDGNILIDDDGRWYFYWAGWEGIWACEMTSPTEFGEPVLTGAQMNGWTEGPFVMKRDGRYYMTLTGNHYLSPGYRINVAVSDNPIQGFADDPLNPVLIDTEGPDVGLGHSSSAIGPDLVSTYIGYHSIKPDTTRDFHLDQQVWCGRSMQVLGPSKWNLDPSLPDVFCDWRGDSADQWSTTSGDLKIEGLWATVPEGKAIWQNALISGVFTSEATIAGTGTTAYSLLLTTGENDAVVRIELDPKANVAIINNVKSPLPSGFAHETAHVLRLEYNGVLLKVYIDGRLQGSIDQIKLSDLKLALDTSAPGTRLGYVALTHSTRDEADLLSVKPIPSKFWAGLTKSKVPFEEPTMKTPQRRVLLNESKVAQYELVASTAGQMRIFIQGEFENNGWLEISIAGPDATTTPETSRVRVRTTTNTVVNGSIDIPSGQSLLQVRATKGNHVLDLIEIYPEVSFQEIRVSDIEVDGYAKELVSQQKFHDAEVSALLAVDRAAVGGHGDLLLRASHLALGYEGQDSRLGMDFFLGYSVQLYSDKVVIMRHAYDHTVLAELPGSFNLSETHHVRAIIQGGEIEVSINSDVKICAVDPMPHTVGGVGIRAVESKVRVLDLRVTPLVSTINDLHEIAT